jgi:hypothetical protein
MPFKSQKVGESKSNSNFGVLRTGKLFLQSIEKSSRRYYNNKTMIKDKFEYRKDAAFISRERELKYLGEYINIRLFFESITNSP